jgi:hypothetical protein
VASAIEAVETPVPVNWRALAWRKKTVRGADSKDNQSGEMVRGRAEQGSVDSFELKLISEKDSHVIGSDTGKHRRFETQP